MAQNDYLFPMMNFPKNTSPGYQEIMDTLKTPTPTMSEFLPQLEQILSQRSQFLQPQIAGLQENIGQGMAGLQGAFGRRGLTGSSIEAQGLATAQGQGNQAMAGLLGNFGLESSKMFAQLLQQARAGDIQAAQHLKELLAQAMGEELTAQRDMDMFQRNLDFQGDQSARNRKQQMINSLIGLGGSAASMFRFGGGGAGGAQPSDLRLKKNVRTIAWRGPIRFVVFTWNKLSAKLGLNPGKEEIGVVAQEVERVYPDVIGEKNGYMTVNYRDLVKRLEVA